MTGIKIIEKELKEVTTDTMVLPVDERTCLFFYDFSKGYSLVLHIGDTNTYLCKHVQRLSTVNKYARCYGYKFVEEN